MSEKQMIPCLYLHRGKTVMGMEDKSLFNNGDVEGTCRFYSDGGADELLVYDLSSTDEEHDKAVGVLKEICRISQAPVAAIGHVRRAEDVKKFLYAGCQRVVLDFSEDSNRQMLKEVSGRFGKDKIAVSISSGEEFLPHRESIETYAGAVFAPESVLGEEISFAGVRLFLYMQQGSRQKTLDLLCQGQMQGICGGWMNRLDASILDFKRSCKEIGIAVDTFESKIAWSDFKRNREGLVPVIVQDCQTDEVLMLAYMDEEAFQATLRSGRMTYWSRSREELWTKGMTSGNFQYMKSMKLDCDNDTILAKVAQVGAACHTGKHSCFFQELAGREDHDEANPLKVFQQVYEVILDRKEHPREGSYTNYLFSKGIDKILKKLGEECTEIVIAAKNPDKEEIKYEISDFLYHMMVLMAEKGVSWEDITQELSRR